jgi:hypothetical protein
MKVELKKSESKKVKKVELREPTVMDLIVATRMSGGSESGIEFNASLISTVGLFDGAPLSKEEVCAMGLTDFLPLIKALFPEPPVDAPSSSSSSQPLGSSPIKI